MKNIIIDEKNKEMYESYLQLQNKVSKEDLIMSTILSLLISLVCFSSLSFISISILYKKIVEILLVFSIFVVMPLRLIYIMKKNQKKIKEQYPDFDETLSINEIEKALDKYNESLKTQEMLVEDTSFRKETTEEKVRVLDRFMSMSNDEKIAFLQKEREFYEQAKQRKQVEEQAKQKKYNI